MEHRGCQGVLKKRTLMSTLLRLAGNMAVSRVALPWGREGGGWDDDEDKQRRMERGDRGERGSVERVGGMRKPYGRIVTVDGCRE